MRIERCLVCGRFVWPWQRQGWIVGAARWHGEHPPTEAERIALYLEVQARAPDDR